MELTLMNLFDGYVRNYHTLNLTIQHGRHSFTMAEIEYFSRLGSMLGYSSFTEDTADGTVNPMDLTWWDHFDGEYWHDFMLHLERENSFGKDEETLVKLFCDREYVPRNVIGIMNVRNRDRITELLTIATDMCEIQNALLIFKTRSTGKKQDYFDEVDTYLLNKNDVVTSKTAFVTDISGALYMYFKEEK